MIEYISSKVATTIKTASGNEQANLDVIRYGLIVIMNSAAIFVICIIIGIITGHTSEILLALIAFSVLRMVSGGFHLKTPAGCITLSVVTMSAIPFIPITETVSMFMSITTLLLVLLFAPSNIREQTRIPERYFFIFKIIALLITSTNLFLKADVLTLAFFIQSLSLINVRR